MIKLTFCTTVFLWGQLIHMLQIDTDKFNTASYLTVAVVALASTIVFLFMQYKNTQKANVALLLANAKERIESNREHAKEIKELTDVHAREIKQLNDEHFAEMKEVHRIYTTEIKMLNDRQLQRYEDIINENKRVLQEVQKKL